MSAQLLTKYLVHALRATQHLPTASWRIQQRGFLFGIELDEDSNLLGIARQAMIQSEMPDQEIEVVDRGSGRFLIREAAFGRPIFEFTPVD
jgi:hypothetical protein